MFCEKSDANNIKLNLQLIQLDRVGDWLFLIGTILAFISTYQVEHSLLQNDSKPAAEQEVLSVSGKPADTIAVFNWIFFVASLFFAYTSYTRLKEQQAEIDATTSSTGLINFQGSQIATLGSLVKVAGFGLSAIGNQIKADNPKE